MLGMHFKMAVSAELACDGRTLFNGGAALIKHIFNILQGSSLPLKFGTLCVPFFVVYCTRECATTVNFQFLKLVLLRRNNMSFLGGGGYELVCHC